jgi:hypothetical protein
MAIARHIDEFRHNSVSKRAEKGFRPIRDHLDRAATKLAAIESSPLVSDNVEAGLMPQSRVKRELQEVIENSDV